MTSDLGLNAGSLDIKSVGPIAFGPPGILFVADNANASIFAIEVDDSGDASQEHSVKVDKLDTLIASHLGCPRSEVFIRGMAVSPSSQQTYLSVMRGSGDEGSSAILRIGVAGTISEVSLDNVRFSKETISDAADSSDERKEVRLLRGEREGEDVYFGQNKYRVVYDKYRTITVTDMSFVDGTLLVAGASNEEFSSTFRRLEFPFKGSSNNNSLEIYHVSHGKYETASPIRNFRLYNQKKNVVASYTCTPVVNFSVDDFTSDGHVKGKTVAELGSGNTPLGMVSYLHDGEEYLLVSNSHYPLMKIACKDINSQDELTEPKEPLGVKRENLPHEGVLQMDNLNGSEVIMLQEDSSGNFNLRSYSTATL